MTSQEGRRPDLRIYADRTVLQPGSRHVAMLNPFWDDTDDPEDPSYGRYDTFIAEGKTFLKLTTFDESNVVLFPIPWELAKDSPAAVDNAWRLATLAAEHGKPFLIFFWSDSVEPVPIAPSIVFRTSLNRSHRQANELAMPAWSGDFLECYLEGKQAIRPWTERPTVGFCGFAAPRSSGYRALVKRMLGRSAGPARAPALAALAASQELDTRFVIRDRFFGGSLLPTGEADYEVMRRVRREYVDNMIETDYGLAARGAGNFSYRLYELLSCGRVPLFVNTDCMLPFDEEIDWKRFMVWVDESELKAISDRLLDFHSQLDDDSFADLQRDCRRVWVDRLSPQGFFRHLHLHFQPDGNGRLHLKTA